MLHAIQNDMTLRHYLPVSSAVTKAKTEGSKKQSDKGKPEKNGVPADLTARLNELAKGRPFNNLHRVKKHDPL